MPCAGISKAVRYIAGSHKLGHSITFKSWKLLIYCRCLPSSLVFLQEWLTEDVPSNWWVHVPVFFFIHFPSSIHWLAGVLDCNVMLWNNRQTTQWRMRSDFSFQGCLWQLFSVHLWSHPPTQPIRYEMKVQWLVNRPDHNTGDYVPEFFRTVMRVL